MYCCDFIRHAAIVGLTIAVAGCGPDPNVWTQHNDNARTGAYLAETTLTPKSVRERGMRVKYWLKPCNGPVRSGYPDPAASRGCIVGAIMSQPLFVRSVAFHALDGRTADGAFVSTSANVVYAVNADTGQQMWATTLGGGQGSAGSVPRGINAAPVIDVGANRMYVVYGLRNHRFDWPGCDEKGPEADARRATLRAEYWLAMLDLRSGHLIGNPVKISAWATTAAGARVQFDGKAQLNQPALLLDRGTLHIAFGAYAYVEACVHDYHGWVMRYDAKTLAQEGAFCTSTDASPQDRAKYGGAGIWQAGGGLAADADGHVYFLTGNGLARSTLPANVRQKEALYGDAMVKLRRPPLFLEYFTSKQPQVFFPAEAADDQGYDADFGAGGATVIPDAQVVIGGGKSGYMYVVKRADMTQHDVVTAATNQYNNDPALRTRTWDKGPHLHGSPTYWRGPDRERAAVYVWGEKDMLRRYDFNLSTQRIEGNTGIHAGVKALWRPMPGGMISVSANGNASGSGIVWATLPVTEGDAPFGGYLYAFDAETLQFLWNDRYGLTARWVPPTIAAGKVFVAAGREYAAGSEALIVYELGNGNRSGDKPYEPSQKYCKFCHVSESMTNQLKRLASMSDHFAGGGAMDGAAAGALTQLPVPDGHAVSAVLHALGERLYEARKSSDDQRLVWQIKDSSASLSMESQLTTDAEEQPRPRARFASESSWVADDGSTLMLERLASVPAPMHTDSEWALFRGVRSSREGLLGGTTYVRRVLTHAGNPPGELPARPDATVRVPYYAEYWLYRERPKPLTEAPHR